MKSKLNRTYKDRLFRLIFQDKRELLALYNAMNGSDYDDPEDLIITTLEDVIYMSMKNDVAFLMGDVLNLWEHQSSYNPNMPLRGLLYFARLYRRYLDEHNISIYSSSLKKLPFPQYVVFYNGLGDEPDRRELLLSDAFIQAEGRKMEPCLEVKAVMLNINMGKNQKLMDECQRLKEYAVFVASIREGLVSGLEAETAVENAIRDCLQNGILTDILSKHKQEVIGMFLTEYDDQKFMEWEREERFEAGRQEGIAVGLEQGRAAGMAEGRAAGMAEGRAEGRAAGMAEGRAEGRAAGMAEGKAEGIAGAVCMLLEEKGQLPGPLQFAILAEKDIETLNGWLKAAGRSTSLEEFLKQTGLEDIR